MKHICETMKDYHDAMNTSMQGDVIFCSEKLWKQIFNSQPESSEREDSILRDFLKSNPSYIDENDSTPIAIDKDLKLYSAKEARDAALRTL